MEGAEEKGWKRGIAQGIEQGVAKEKKDMALKMKQGELPIEQIVLFTGLSVEEVLNLQY